MTEERREQIRRYLEAKLAENNQPQEPENDLPAVIASRMVPKKKEKTLSGFVGNIGTSAGELVEGMAHAIAHPIETAKGIGKLAGGALQKAGVLSGDEYIPYADAVGQFYKDRYGGLENIIDTGYSDPVGFLADLATAPLAVAGGAGAAARTGLLSGQMAARAGKITQAAKKAANRIDPFSIPVNAIKAAAQTERGNNLARFAGKKLTSAGTFFKSGLTPRKAAETAEYLNKYNLISTRSGLQKAEEIIKELAKEKDAIVKASPEEKFKLDDIYDELSLDKAPEGSRLYKFKLNTDPSDTVAIENVFNNFQKDTQVPSYLDMFGKEVQPETLFTGPELEKRRQAVRDTAEGLYNPSHALNAKQSAQRYLLDTINDHQSKVYAGRKSTPDGKTWDELNQEISELLKIIENTKDSVFGANSSKAGVKEVGMTLSGEGNRRLSGLTEILSSFVPLTLQKTGNVVYGLSRPPTGNISRFAKARQRALYPLMLSERAREDQRRRERELLFQQYRKGLLR